MFRPDLEIGKHATTLVEYFNRARVPLAEVIEKLRLPSNRCFRYAKKQLDTIICCIIDDHQSARFFVITLDFFYILPDPSL